MPTLNARADLARCLDRLGELDAAREHLRAVVDLTLETGAPAEIAEAFADLGDLEFRNARLAPAAAAYDAALTWARRGTPATPTEARMLSRVAVARFELGDDDGVREFLEAALTIYELDGEAIIDVVETEFTLAQVLWADGSDPQRALDLAEQAHARISSDGVVEADHRDEIETWLRERLGEP
ncbi:MAG: hypothetical protein IPK74_33180 [Deltaproteobacteria bacterium]|nr:hypothetical protein [Deltaproteobacteria bacterium]